MRVLGVDVVVIAGAPGSGKSTLMNALAEALPGWPPRIEFSDLREWHLDPQWQNQSPNEEAIAFENLVFVIENYRRHGHTPVLVTDLRERRVNDIVDHFGEGVAVISLVATDDVIRRRIGTRSAGFTDAEQASAWNARVTTSPLLSSERRFDTSERSVVELAEDIYSALDLG